MGAPAIANASGPVTSSGSLAAEVRQALARALGRRAAGTEGAGDHAIVDRLVAALTPEAWPLVPAWVEAAGVGPTAWAELGSAAPPDVADALADLSERTLARGRRLAEERQAIAAAFHAEGVPFQPLKGAWSADRVWSPPEARPMADIDLYVETAGLPGAERALAGLGYEHAARTWKHRVYARPDNRVVVDWRGEHPDNPRPVELHASMGEALRGISWAGSPAGPAPGSALREPAVLAHALAHASVDIMERRLRLVTLIDIARLVTVLADATWQRALVSMAEPGAARFAWPVLATAARELGVALPTGAEAIGGAVRTDLKRWLDAASLDALSRVAEEGHGFLELARVWPLDGRERRAMWRHAVAPGRWELADRYPRMAGSRAWPLVYARHAAFCLGLGAMRTRRAISWGRRQT